MSTLPGVTFVFHEDEKYYPSSADFFLKHSHLYDAKKHRPIKFDPSSKDVYDSTKGYASKTHDIYIKVNDNFDVPDQVDNSLKTGFKDNLGNVPIYFYKHETVTHSYINYIVFYPYNGSYNILGIERTGQHWGDIEHLTFETDKATGALTRVFFAAHGAEDGKWVPVNEIEKDASGNFLIYIAVNGHGFYPSIGEYYRVGGMANDVVSDKGLRFTPTPGQFNQILDHNDPNYVKETMGWAHFQGVWGQDGISSLIDKGWYNKVDPLVTYPPKLVNSTWMFVRDWGVYIILFILAVIVVILGNSITYRLPEKELFKMEVSYIGAFALGALGASGTILGGKKIKKLISTI
jgi:hypothetical protein